ncbi:MAG: IS200/IS605 family transposase [Gemmataceae bacterium]
MPQSLAALYVHLVYSTKDRAPVLTPDWRPELFAVMGGIVRNKQCVMLEVGGVLDHLHALVSFHRQESIADLVRDLKANSSNWIHQHIPRLSAFAWQAGYAAFSVGFRELRVVRPYVADQESHHGGVSFQDEMRRMLTEHGVEYDERYVWG